MEMEQLDPRAGPLPFQVKAVSRESPTQRAAHLLEPDLRSHWSAGTNTKEWIILELEEPCLLSRLRIYNKSVLEWEISVGLQYKPEAFVKVRPRCEAPKRDMIYHTDYIACRYLRVSCLRGNPISIYFVQLIGISVSGLEPEFQPVVNHLLPHIISHKQDSDDLYLKLLRDVTGRLSVFLPYLETDLSKFSEEPESAMRFLAMVAGPYHPLLKVVKEREAERTSGGSSDGDLKVNQTSTVTVSSNFEAQSRRPRSTISNYQPTFSFVVFRPDIVFMFLRKAYKEKHLGLVSQVACLSLQKLLPPSLPEETSPSLPHDESEKTSDYSTLFGDEFSVIEKSWDISLTSLLDISTVEEGVFHMLYACAAQPLLCGKLAESEVDFLSILPLVQALLPALRPPPIAFQDPINEDFLQWEHPLVRRALTQIVSLSSSSAYYPLLCASAGFLSSFSPSQAKAACVMIDLCSGALGHWLPMVTAKVDLTVELIEDLLSVIQGVASRSVSHPRIALKYIILALSGHVDDILAKYKEVKLNILFLIEMLERYLEPVLSTMEHAIKGKQKESFEMALDLIRTAVQKPSILPHLEREWRWGSVLPSVLLSILGPDLPFPPEIDMLKSTTVNGNATKSRIIEESDDKISTLEVSIKGDIVDDASLLFAPEELRSFTLINIPGPVMDEQEKCETSSYHWRSDASTLDDGFSPQYFNLRANFLQLVHYEDYKSRALQFRQLALNLHSQPEVSPEGHAMAIDALLLAADCYLNPFSLSSTSRHLHDLYAKSGKELKKDKDMEPKRFFTRSGLDQERIASLETRRDETVLEILLQAAELDQEYVQKLSPNQEQYNRISSFDVKCADSITIVRQNQDLLCNFIMRYLKRDELVANKTLLQGLLFVLQSSTELCCLPDDIITVILRSAKHLNDELASYHLQSKGATMKLDPSKVIAIQRHCSILQKLVIFSLGIDDDDDDDTLRDGLLCRSMVPPKSWIEKIPIFSKSPSPLVRFLGWKAVSLSAKMYLTSKTSHLSTMLSIFGDDMAVANGDEHCSFQILFPELYRFLPTMKKQFVSLSETILQAVCHRLSLFPTSAISDILCWLSDLCRLSFLQSGSAAVKNTKNITLFVLDAVMKEHMEYMIPEMPRVAEVLFSVCRSSYSDVSFLDAVFARFKPLISYALRRATQDETVLADDSFSSDLESICFGDIFSFLSRKKEKELYREPQVIFLLGGLYPDLSFRRKKEILLSLAEWANFTTSSLDHLLAFQCVMDSCTVSLERALENVGVSFPIQRDKEERETTLDVKPMSLAEVGELSDAIEGLVRRLLPTIETCWSLHSKLAMKLTTTIAKSVLFLHCSSSLSTGKDQSNWVLSFEGLAEEISKCQKNHCWQVASLMVDYVLGLPLGVSDNSMIHICSVISTFACAAPRISWRLQADKWLQSLFSNDFSNLSSTNDHLIDMFSSMLRHWEPEQRHIALKNLGSLVGLHANDLIISKVVLGLWDKVASMASSDSSTRLRAHAMALLSNFVPFAEQRKLQVFLVGAHALPGLCKDEYKGYDLDFARLSLALLASICVFSSFEDVSLVSDDVWQGLEVMMSSKSEFGDAERSLCEALLQLRTNFDHAKEALNGALSSISPSKESDPNFNDVRESILQVISSLASVQEYFDFFSKQMENEAQELNEVEIELELLQDEQATKKNRGPKKEGLLFSSITDDSKKGSRLQEIKEEIRSIEKSKLKEEVISRRQQKLVLRRERRKHQEEATLREMELLHELDRERAREAEREIERQRLLEVERAKTRELRHNLDLERERQAQRDLQRELEMAESGVSSSSSRPRERYREREAGRTIVNEGIRGGRDRGTPGGPRSSFMVQPPTILQAADRTEERIFTYDDSYEGGRDLGDAGAGEDPESASSSEHGGFLGGQRLGRGGKPRMIMERRERDGRREGKWERKNS